MRIDRMLAITMMMLNRNRITARDLADKFEVSVRTIYRDLQAIDQAGIPVVSYSGNQGGYGIMDTFRIDRQYLTFEDIVSMVTTLRGINTTLENKELDLAIEKIATLVPGHRTDAFEDAANELVVDIMPMGYTRLQKERIRDVNHAVHERRLLAFDYSNTKYENTNRTVEPMTLVFKGYAWYLFAWCRLKNAFRIFRLSRMRNIKILDETFERRKETYDAVFSGQSPTSMVHLELLFSPDARVQAEDFFEPDQTSLEKDGSLKVSLDFPEDEWMYSFLLGYGEHVKVLAPAHVQDTLRKKAGNILRNYKPDNLLSQA